MNLLYFPLTDSSELGSMPGEKERGRGGWKGKEQMIEERKEHGWLRNDFNESTESPADTLDMTLGAWRRKKGKGRRGKEEEKGDKDRNKKKRLQRQKADIGMHFKSNKLNRAGNTRCVCLWLFVLGRDWWENILWNFNMMKAPGGFGTLSYKQVFHCLQHLWECIRYFIFPLL